MKRILVIGAAGMIGHQMWFHLRKKWEVNVYATIRKSKSAYKQFHIFDDLNVYDNVDVRDFVNFQSLLEKIKPNEIINCTGITIRKPEINDWPSALMVNSVFPRKLSKWAQNNNARLIQFSTDCVFDGKKGFYTENDIPNSTDNYGITKYLGELNEKNCLTLRFPVIGRELEGKTELLEWMIAQKNKTVKGYSKAMYSGITTLEAAKEIVRIIQDFPNLTGLFHVANQPVSKYSLLCLINKYFNVGATIKEDSSYATNKVLIASNYALHTQFQNISWDKMLKDVVEFNNINYGGE